MLKIPEIFKGTENFWEWNSQYIIVFEEFYKKDKSKKKNKSSTIMWGIYFLVHPKSDLYNLPTKEILIIDNYIKDKKFKWEQVEDEQELFIQTILSQAERSLASLDSYMNTRDTYLKSKDYYFDEYATDENGNNILSKTGAFVTIKGTAEQLDKAYAVTPKMFAEYDKIKKALAEDEVKRGRNSKPRSPSETGEI